MLAFLFRSAQLSRSNVSQRKVAIGVCVCVRYLFRKVGREAERNFSVDSGRGDSHPFRSTVIDVVQLLNCPPHSRRGQTNNIDSSPSLSPTNSIVPMAIIQPADR